MKGYNIFGFENKFMKIEYFIWHQKKTNRKNHPALAENDMDHSNKESLMY